MGGMSEYESLREDMAGMATAVGNYHALVRGHLLEQSRQIDKLWKDNAALRDELHAVANRLESLTRYATTDPAEVAAKIVTDANKGMLPVTIVRANLNGEDA